MSQIATPLAPADAIQPAEQVHTNTHRLKLAHLWAIVPLVVAWFAESIDYIEPFDFWWNLKSGQIMMQTGHFLGTDILVWSPVREPYYNPQWLSQLLFYWIYNASPYLMLTARALIITASVGLILWICGWRAKSLRVAGLATLITFFTAWTNYGVRPQLFAFLPFLGFLLILERKDTHPQWLPLLVPLMLFWVNSHGSFLLGGALVTIYAVGSCLEKIGSREGREWLRSRAAIWQLFWFAATGLATLLNPYFLDIYRYFSIATNDPIARAANIEWQPPTLSNGTGQLFFAQVVIFLASLYFSRRRLRATELLLIAAFGYLALTSLRNVMWWGWVTAPMLAANFAAISARRSKFRAQSSAPTAQRIEAPALNWLIVVLLAGGALAVTPLWRQASPLVPPDAKPALSETTPTKVADFLANSNLPGPLFNYLEWGGYLEWELYPRYRMFVDGRFEARQVQVWLDYLSVSHGRADWQQTLDRYGIRTLVLNKEFHKDLIPFVSTSSAWHKVYEDKTAVVFTR